MSERSHLSIGEVLSLLQEEFPDVTISKIRFLESQGLLDPERTPSGYRKFYDDDIERLRWILRQQREHFLPLKIIKDRLAEHEGAIPPDTIPAVQLQMTEAEPEMREPATAADREPVQGHLDTGPTSVSMTIDELVAASGLTVNDVRELERYGLLAGRAVGSETLYEAEALVVARLAAGFRRFGVEARHLRMYRSAAEREAGFFEQVVMPMVKQRNPTARRQAVETLAELSRLGDGMRSAMLRRSLRDYSGLR